MTNCYTGINNPDPQISDPCNGIEMSTDCVKSPNANITLDLAAGASQSDINAALTTALVYKEQQITDLAAVDNATYIEAGTNVTVTGIGIEADPYIINTIKPYKVLTGLIDQGGINPPTLEIYENTTGYTITTEYFSIGTYLINFEDPLNELPIPFPNDNTWCIIANDVGSFTSIFQNSNERLIIKTKNTSNVLTNDLLYGRTFEIRIYN